MLLKARVKVQGGEDALCEPAAAGAQRRENREHHHKRDDAGQQRHDLGDDASD